MVTSVLINPGAVVYDVTWAEGEVTRHFEMELRKTYVHQWIDEDEAETSDG